MGQNENGECHLPFGVRIWYWKSIKFVWSTGIDIQK